MGRLKLIHPANGSYQAIIYMQSQCLILVFNCGIYNDYYGNTPVSSYKSLNQFMARWVYHLTTHSLASQTLSLGSLASDTKLHTAQKLMVATQFSLYPTWGKGYIHMG